MKRILVAIVLGALLAPAAQAAPVAVQPPSDASIKALFEAMHASSLLDGIWSQMNNMMDSTIKQTTANQPLNEAQRAIASDMSRQMADLFKESMAWEKLEPVMAEVYKQSFTQADVDGMLKFYRSPAGLAVIQKMPVVMQNTMKSMEGMTRDMMPKLQQIVQDSAEKLKAAGSAPAAQAQ